MAAPADNYILSRDISEADRLRVQQDYMLSCQGYYLHPDIPQPSSDTRIADVCTGSAVFILPLAKAYPDAEFHGFDISDKMYPSNLPSNVSLYISDVKKPVAPELQGYFDVVHLRFIEAAMKKDDWAPVLQNLISMLKPGGWLQWVEDDRAHSVRHAARPVAPRNAAEESLAGGGGSSRFVPPKAGTLDRFNRLIMPNARADDMTYGYMNLDALMKDADVGNMEEVNCDIYVIDREDDGGKLRRDWATMGIAAVDGMLKAYAASGNQLANVTREELEKGFMEDIARGSYFVTRASVFTGRKKV